MGEFHRPWLLREVKTDWVLQIDPDEFLSSGAQAAVLALVASGRADCYALVWPIWNGTTYITHSWPHKKALYRRAAARYLGVPHEEVRIDGKIEHTVARLEHRPSYNNLSIATVRTKWNRWLTVHAQALLSDQTSWDTFPGHVALRPRYYFIVTHPLLYSLPVFLYHLAATIMLGGWKAGLPGLKLGIYTSAYYFALCVRIHRLK